ncbi:MAG: sialate O-acetylesterase [Verrucomicrobiota bacterium]
MSRPLSRVLALLAALSCAALGHADITVAPLFSDGAVLQRDKPVALWGRADAGEKIVITFAGQTREATAMHDGRWIAFLDPLPATAQGSNLTLTGKNTLTLHDVLVGEVWLCSGQSNMEWPVSRAANGPQEIAAAEFPLIRHVKIGHTVSLTPLETAKTTGWQQATPQTTGAFSAVAYFFARDLHLKLEVPIGIVVSTWGGTPVEAWMSPAALAADPAFRLVDERWAQMMAEHLPKKAAFDTAFAEWTKAEAAAKAQGKPAHDAFLKKNPRQWEPPGPGHPWTPRGLFNGMINPLLPYALRGVIWYQGENNVDRPGEYHALFKTMIEHWRAHFGQGDLPFFWVNLAAFGYPTDPTGVRAAALREAQNQTLALPNTGEALAIDIGHPTDIHPTNKQEVGRRLALLARHRVYDFTGDDSGPVFAGIAREGAALRVRFTHAVDGLIAYQKPVQSLQLAGADRVFHPAEARIDRDTLVVTSRAVKDPVAVRYAWSNAPVANLYNGSGLPAAPFRSDNW